MKMHLLLLFFTLLTCHQIVAQQTSRTGYVDYQAVYNQLPDASQAQQESFNAKKQLEESLEAKRKDYNSRYMQAYEAAQMKPAFTLTPSSTKPSTPTTTFPAAAFEAEHKKLLEEEKSQREELHKQEKLKQLAITAKIKKAIQEVASEKGYQSVMDTSTLLYFPPEDNLTPLVLSKLGVSSK